ncbi:hypothetical protein NM208_g5885 [Fusarium decemcellulare]|uniref:Uncharacterized protein n=1 Tax=Fusarium decemcellulare TaxID=57161 RepID=A0ACC1SF50_9HYPO|nr:hypothetical protein NM208_g5885 [Fusarium decemcellulare]
MVRGSHVREKQPLRDIEARLRRKSAEPPAHPCLFQRSRFWRYRAPPRSRCPNSASRQAARDAAPAENAFWQTDVGWFDDGTKKREAPEKREPAENAFWQTDVGWFDDGTKKRDAPKKRAKNVWSQTDVGWFDSGDKKRDE